MGITAAPETLRHHLARVDGRRVHWLRCGEGSPVLLVHSSPTNAWYVAPQMRMLAARHTCFAFDTPGFGLSDPLPGEPLAVADLADAIAANLEAVGVPRCPVFGTHTGAAIALSLAARHPQRVSALVLDGLPLFTPDEFEALFGGYFHALQPDELGGHYARDWTRFRDQYVWFPWTQRHPDRQLGIDIGPPASVHGWAMGFYHCGRHYKPAYRAALTYGAQGAADLDALQCPAVLCATQTDMLHPHLARVTLKPGQEIRAIGQGAAASAARDALIAEVFARWPATEAAPGRALPAVEGAGLQERFVDRDGAHQVLLRHAGRSEAPALLLLHDAPGSGALLARPGGLIESLARRFRVLAPDLPGCGGSDPIEPGAEASIDAWADALAATCEALGVRRTAVYGLGIGAALALALARRHPALASHVVLRGLPLPEPAQRAELIERYAPPIEPQADGSHWYRTWLMLRDQQIYFPWYEPRVANARRVEADFGADPLHEWTFEVMKQHASYHHVIRAALAADSAAALQGLQRPLARCSDPQQPFFAHDAALRALRPDAVALPADAAAHAEALLAFLDTSS